MHRTEKYSQCSSIIWSIWPNGWVLVHLSGCRFESCCSHLNFRYCTCFEQGVPWHSGKYGVWIHSEMRTWHDKNIQATLRLIFSVLFDMPHNIISNLVSRKMKVYSDVWHAFLGNAPWISIKFWIERDTFMMAAKNFDTPKRFFCYSSRKLQSILQFLKIGIYNPLKMILIKISIWRDF